MKPGPDLVAAVRGVKLGAQSQVRRLSAWLRRPGFFRGHDAANA